MKIQINQIKIPDKLELKEPISDDDFLNLSVDFLVDGYELTELEQFVYSKNKIPINKNYFNHKSSIDEWFSMESDRVYCDHAAILYRYSFENYYPQILKLKNQKKELVRFFDVKSKYGLDFYLQFLCDDYCFDIIHIENDYFHKSELIEHKEKIEEFILSTDWEDVGLGILSKKSEWENLLKDDQYNWKANYFGFPRAYLTRK